MNHYHTYYTSSLLKYRRLTSHSFSGVGEIIIGAMLLLSPIFWIFIAELIK